MDYAMPVKTASLVAAKAPYMAHQCAVGWSSWPPFWWLDQPFGFLVFILVFLTWGLIILALVLGCGLMLKKLMHICELEAKAAKDAKPAKPKRSPRRKK
jgi:hypothetical protein